MSAVYHRLLSTSFLPLLVSLLEGVFGSPTLDDNHSSILLDLSATASPSGSSEMTVPTPLASAAPGECPVETGNASDDSPYLEMLMSEVLRFRDALGLGSCDDSVPLIELLNGTLEDLKKKYPKYSSCIEISENHESFYQELLHFNKVLKSIGDSWSEKCNHSTIFNVQELDLTSLSVIGLAERAIVIVEYMVSHSKQMFDVMDMVASNASVPEYLRCKPFSLSSPRTPTSVLPESPKGLLKQDSNISYFPPLLRPIRLEDVGNLHAIDVKDLSFHMFPLVVDHSSHPDSQKNQMAGDLRLEPSKAFVKPNQPILLEKDVYINDISELHETTSLDSTPSTPNLNIKKVAPGSTVTCPPSTPRHMSLTELLMPSMAYLKQMNIEPSVESANMNEHDCYSNNFCSESTIFSLPILQFGASGTQNQIASMPSSPMVLAGVLMPFSPGGHAHSDNFDEFKTSEYTLVSSQPSNRVLHPKSPLGMLDHQSRPAISHSKSPLAQAQPPTPPKLPVFPTAATQTSPPYHTTKVDVPPPPPPPPLTSKSFALPVQAIPKPTPSSAIPSIPTPSQETPLPGAPMQSISLPLPSMIKSSLSEPTQPVGFASPTRPSLPPSPPSLPFHTGLTLPPPLPGGSASSSPSLPLTPLEKGSTGPSAPPLPAQACPPPPPPAMRSLRAKVTKLKRSSQMGNLYRFLKVKLEGSSLPSKALNRQKSLAGSSDGKKGGQGMADALAEMAKRSTYFQHIEEDVHNYSTSILDIKSDICNFRPKNMVELQNFHQHVEKLLEKLTDETQVLARFEDFPYNKLESMRIAVALYLKLDGMITTLKTWKIVQPVSKQLDKIETYFSKIKEEVDAIERTKEEESKKFKSNDIEFDFGILVRIKEAMVDLSSSCIEMALKESRRAKEEGGTKSKSNDNLSKLLWRAFQLAFRVYNFAGGQDERADRLTSELAREIETYS
ncbi:hypothetical protein HPP92_016702 [Vanilla planifolia]|uniref:Hydroxyproline-rich glycoprotein family protein n=1 Tax=Vanilla planifolia TaxID=51239 RepID=A0A835UQ86_VANPL|nr:hypothetical protein HPP92_016702 [Vanilla planifolia]